MEFLLINHPLDCPICDQGGECDLQDQAMGYGMDHSRYRGEQARGARTSISARWSRPCMTRCIHCTRCIRFATEIAGVAGARRDRRAARTWRSRTYVEKALGSELSGNMIDLCPVGALTSKPYAFVARPWELRKTDSVDVLDAVGSNIRIDSRGREVLRILPRLNEEVNEEWMADKSRFCDRRAEAPAAGPALGPPRRQAAPGELARGVRGDRANGCGGVPGERIGAVAGDLCDAESMVALKDLMRGARLAESRLPAGRREARCRAPRGISICSTRRSPASSRRTRCLLIGTNPRREAPLVNARIRKRWLAGRLPDRRDRPGGSS